MGVPHPICVRLRELRQALGLSLQDVQDRYGLKAVRVGSYERGDRIPPLTQLEAALNIYGYRLAAEPIGPQAVRPSLDIVAELRAIANQLEATHDVYPVLPPGSFELRVPEELHVSAPAVIAA